MVIAAAGCPRRAVPDIEEPPRQTEAPRPQTPPGMLECTTRELGSDIAGWPTSLVLADLDGDGALDAAVEYSDTASRPRHSRLSIQRGDGDGGLREVQNLGLGGLSYALGAADLDGDGRPELFTNDYNGRHLLVFTGDGGGRMRGPTRIRSRFQPGGINPHDTDGDGDLDLVVASFGHVQIFENRGGLDLRGAGAVAVPQAPDEVVAVDLDRDGRRELMVVANDSNKLYQLGVRPGNRLVIDGVSATCRKPSVTQAADLDGDGAADLAFRCGDELVVRLSSTGATIRTTSPGLEKVGLGDLDADGDIDAITAGQPCSTCASHIRLLANDGRGSFSERSVMEVDGSAGSPVIADVDGDRAPDVVMTVWTGTAPGRVVVYLGGACGRLKRP